MNIIQKYPEELDKKLAFKMTKEDSIRLSDCEGQTLDVEAFVLYEDTNAKGDVVRILAILSEGQTYSTVSQTFIKSFLDIDETFRDDGYAIIVDGGSSKAGRHYLDCKIA